jgi:hypothetical protein
MRLAVVMPPGDGSIALGSKGELEMGFVRDFFGADDSVTDVASAGNGGVATSSANGGAVSLGNVNSGGNAGNAVGVGDTVGSVAVDGGDVSNSTDIGVTAN